MLSKYSANGNDFVIFHALEKKDRSSLAKELCDRQNGVGADGLIVLIPHDKHDFEW
jgi:diaminopimelate epimerase